MVRKLMALLALVLMMGMSVMPAAAQDADDMAELGIESLYMRMYGADPSAATANTELLGVMAIGIEFEDADGAEAAFEDFSCGFISGFVGIDATDCDGLVDGGLTVSDVDGIGDAGLEATGEGELSGSPTPMTILSVLDQERIFIVINIGVNEPGSGDDLAKFMVNAEPSDAEVVLNDDGTSTGGFFDLLPQEGDKEIEGLMPISDMDMNTDSSSTPTN